MDKIRLGKTDMYVNRVGLGCMGFSHASGMPTPKSEAIEKIRAAFEMGYNLFDTAECYTGVNEDGSISYNEELVGEAVASFRNEVIICTKFGVTHKGNYLELNSSPEAIRKSVEGSLEKLGTDYIDLYYQHRIDPNVEPEIVAGVMKELIEEGKIKAWGISETTDEYLRRAHAVCPVTAIQNRYSMMARWHEPIFSTCDELGITFVAFSPMANGTLTGAYKEEQNFEKGGLDYRNNMPQYTEEGLKRTEQLLDTLKQIATEKQITEGQLSLAWMLNKYDFLIPIPGTRKLSRLKENFLAGEIRLTSEDISILDEVLEKSDFLVFGGHSDK